MLPTILIDDRAGSKDLVDLPPLNTPSTVLTRLEFADAAILGRHGTLVGVEVKSIFDLVNSMRTGRLQATQVPGMLATYSASWLLVYGWYRCDPTSGALQIRKGKGWRDFTSMMKGKGRSARPLSYSYVDSFFLTLAGLGVHVKEVSDKRDAARWVGLLASWWDKPRHRSMEVFDKSQAVVALPHVDARTYQRARVANELPGVGRGRAMAAAQHFSSVRAMVNADEKGWVEVSGIGKAVARAVVDAVS